RGRPQQPRDRRRAVHLGQDRQRARVQHPRQARRDQPRRGRGRRPPPPPLRHLPRPGNAVMIAKDLVPTSGINSFMIMKMSPGYVAVVATGPDELSTSTDRLPTAVV